MTTVGLLALALISGIVGGCLGGMVVGGKHLGNELAAMVGGFYGPMAAIPGVVISLILLALL